MNVSQLIVDWRRGVPTDELEAVEEALDWQFPLDWDGDGDVADAFEWYNEARQTKEWSAVEESGWPFPQVEQPADDEGLDKLAFVGNEQPADGRFYLGLVRPEGEGDDIDYYGPVEGLQITHGWVRDPGDGRHVGVIRQDGLVNMHGNPRLYTDLFLALPEEDKIKPCAT